MRHWIAQRLQHLPRACPRACLRLTSISAEPEIEATNRRQVVTNNRESTADLQSWAVPGIRNVLLRSRPFVRSSDHSELAHQTVAR